MLYKKIILSIAMFLLPFSEQVIAMESGQNLFKPGSYQQILDSNKGKPFVLVIWSTSCPSCLKDMEILKQIHKIMPQFKFIMLATDQESDTVEVTNIIAQHGLTNLESWVFSDENEQMLRYEIDPGWYGELPRTYFFDKDHQKMGISGALTHRQFITILANILEKEQS